MLETTPHAEQDCYATIMWILCFLGMLWAGFITSLEAFFPFIAVTGIMILVMLAYVGRHHDVTVSDGELTRDE